MKIYNKIVFDIQTLEVVEEDWFDYDGPLCLAGDGGDGGGDTSGDTSTDADFAGINADIGIPGETSDSTAANVMNFSNPFTAAINAITAIGSYGTTGVAQGLTGRGQGGNVGDYGGGGPGIGGDFGPPFVLPEPEKVRTPKKPPAPQPKLTEDQKRKRIGRQDTILTKRSPLSDVPTLKPTLLGQ